jgi:hypothetical protein
MRSSVFTGAGNGRRGAIALFWLAGGERATSRVRGVYPPRSPRVQCLLGSFRLPCGARPAIASVRGGLNVIPGASLQRRPAKQIAACRIRLDLALAIETPNDEPHPRRGGVAQVIGEPSWAFIYYIFQIAQRSRRMMPHSLRRLNSARSPAASVAAIRSAARASAMARSRCSNRPCSFSTRSRSKSN